MKANDIITIKPLAIRKVAVRIVGDTPLIMHAWSEKAKRQLMEKTSRKEPRTPWEDFIRSMYWLTDMPTEMTEEGFNDAISKGARFGFPVTAFKQAAVSSAYRLGWTKDKASIRGAFFINSDEYQMVEIKGDSPIMREDLVRVGMGSPDIRWRGEFRNWHADIVIDYNENGKYSLEDVINMLAAGGYVCGVGEWRPEKDGQFGMFHVESV